MELVGKANVNLLNGRGWTSTDNKEFTKGNMSLYKEGNKRSDWVLKQNDQEVFRDSVLNYIMGAAAVVEQNGDVTKPMVKVVRPTEEMPKFSKSEAEALEDYLENPHAPNEGLKKLAKKAISWEHDNDEDDDG